MGGRQFEAEIREQAAVLARLAASQAAVQLDAAIGNREPLFVGAMHPDKTPNGPLVRISGLGPVVGAPALAWNRDHVLVAWADRPGPASPWGVRWTKWRPGSELGDVNAFPVPPGGGGEQVMAPSLTTVGTGRVVMVWTEGGAGRHDVRSLEIPDCSGCGTYRRIGGRDQRPQRRRVRL